MPTRRVDESLPMRISTNIPHFGPLASAAAIREIALAAEALGFDGVSVADHLALPRSVSSQYDLGAQPVGIPEHNMKKTLSPLYECLTTLTFVAGITQRVRLMTGVCVLLLRNPIYNARQIATLDALSGGRVDLGIGAGWLKEEAEAMQLPWKRRGERTDEHIALLRALWESDEQYLSFHGKFYHFEEIDPLPQPVQRPLPILIGGHSPAAKLRAGRIGNGWITSMLDPAEQARGMDDVRAAAIEEGRDPAKLQWFGSVDARYDLGAIKRPEILIGRLRAYQGLGLHDVQIVCSTRSLEDRMRLLELLAKEILPEFRAQL